MRQSNIELCRIISMMLVLTVHSAFATFGGPAEWDKPYYGLIAAQSLSVVGVNVFVLISGWFSIQIKKRSVLKLLNCCLFYAVVSSVFSLINHSFSIKQLLFISEANWFIAAYIGLMVLSPILNTYVENTNKKSLGISIFILLAFQTWYEFVPKLISNFQGGYSILSFCILYLIARYLRLYPLGGAFLKRSWLIYILLSILLMSLVSVVYLFGFKVDFLCGSLLKYNQPIVILSSICLFLFFTNIHLGSSLVINHLAKSCIAVLLLHTSVAINPYYCGLFKNILYNSNGVLTIVYWILAIAGVFILCALIDQVRLFIENRIIFKK